MHSHFTQGTPMPVWTPPPLPPPAMFPPAVFPRPALVGNASGSPVSPLPNLYTSTIAGHGSYFSALLRLHLTNNLYLLPLAQTCRVQLPPINFFLSMTALLLLTAVLLVHRALLPLAPQPRPVLLLQTCKVQLHPIKSCEPMCLVLVYFCVCLCA